MPGPDSRIRCQLAIRQDGIVVLPCSCERLLVVFPNRLTGLARLDRSSKWSTMPPGFVQGLSGSEIGHLWLLVSPSYRPGWICHSPQHFTWPNSHLGQLNRSFAARQRSKAGLGASSSCAGCRDGFRELKRLFILIYSYQSEKGEASGEMIGLWTCGLGLTCAREVF